MKGIYAHSLRFLLSTAMAMALGCQKSVPETLVTEEEDQLGAGSNLVQLIARTALNDGSQDNIIDSANCLTVVLPVTVLANGQEVVVRTEADFQIIENIFERSNSDVDTLQIAFPIQVQFGNYALETAESQLELDELASECPGENELDMDIECVDFQYPVQFDVFQAGGSVPQSVAIGNDEQLYGFLDELDDGDVVELVFPLVLVDFEGTEVQVSSLEELESNLETAVSACDEDDDFDYDDDDNEVFSGFLADGTWIIDEYVFMDEGFTEDFEGFFFSFEAGLSVSANNGSQTEIGSWGIGDGSGPDLMFNLDMGGQDPFGQITENWMVIEIEVDRLALQVGSEATGDLKVLVFEKI